MNNCTKFSEGRPPVGEKIGTKRRRAPGGGPTWFMKGKGGERVSFTFGVPSPAGPGGIEAFNWLYVNARRNYKSIGGNLFFKGKFLS